MNQLPPPPILTPPAGWLGFLGIKSGGRQPGIVNPTLSPTLDMDRFYQAGARVQLQSANLAFVNNASVQMYQCPSGKVALIEYVSAAFLLGVVGAVTAVLEHRRSDGTQIDFSTPTGVIAAASFGFLHFDRPRILLPGDRISILGSAPAAPTAFNFSTSVSGVEVAA